MKNINRLWMLLMAFMVLGLGTSCASDEPVKTWIDLINEEWNNNSAGSSDAVMTGKVNLWEKGNIPTVTRNVNNSDGPDFIPNMEVFTVDESVTPKGAVIICPGGAFAFRSMQNEGYDIADMLVPMGYQCFIVNYRIQPYTMRESAPTCSAPSAMSRPMPMTTA